MNMDEARIREIVREELERLISRFLDKESATKKAAESDIARIVDIGGLPPYRAVHLETNVDLGSMDPEEASIPVTSGLLDSIESGQITINQARQMVGLEPLDDSKADTKLTVQSDHVGRRF